MNLDKLNIWLALIANLGVIAGLVFVGLEVRQNTLAMEREIRISFADNVHGQIAESDYLAPIVSKIMEEDGNAVAVNELMVEYELSAEEAQRWWRHLLQIWLRDQADWIYEGEIDCANSIFKMRFKDQQILFNSFKDSLEPGFAKCVVSGIESEDA
jgi:hypothetical protein